MKSDFCSTIILHNRLAASDFKEWLFYPGMLFNSPDKWWGDRAKRDTLHQGLDLCFYKNRAGEILSLDSDTRIPVIYNGEVVRIINDFLGKTIFVRHRELGHIDQDFYTVYGHVIPCPKIAKGTRLNKGEPLAGIADTAGSRSGLPPHLHISVALISKEITEDMLDWGIMTDQKRVTLFDPLDFIACPHTVSGI